MKIGIISDTHDNLTKVEKAIKILQEEKVSLIIHCGDWVSPFVPQFIFKLEPKLEIPIKSVFGNNEGDHFRFFERKEKENWNIDFFKETLELEMDGKKIVVYHGSSKILTKSLISSKNYAIVLTGHDHKAVIENIEGVLHINPGSVAGYERGYIMEAGTLAVLEVKTGKAHIIKI